MKLCINGKDEVLEKDQLNVTDLLVLQKVKMPDMVSVQINEEFVERKDFSTRLINEGDAVEFLYFMGGGRPGREAVS